MRARYVGDQKQGNPHEQKVRLRTNKAVGTPLPPQLWWLFSPPRSVFQTWTPSTSVRFISHVSGKVLGYSREADEVSSSGLFFI